MSRSRRSCLSEMKLEVAVKPHRDTNPDVLILSVVLLSRGGKGNPCDGKLIYSTNIRIQTKTPCSTLKLLLESDEVSIDQPSTQTIDITERSERQFRIRRRNEESMESKQVFLTLGQSRYLVHLALNPAQQTAERFEQPGQTTILCNVNTSEISKANIGPQENLTI